MTTELVNFEGQKVLAGTLSTEQLVNFVFNAFQGKLLRYTGEQYNSVYQFAQTILYLQSGFEWVLPLITGSQGLRYAVIELRKRLAVGELPDITPLLEN